MGNRDGLPGVGEPSFFKYAYFGAAVLLPSLWRIVAGYRLALTIAFCFNAPGFYALVNQIPLNPIGPSPGKLQIVFF